MEGDGQSRYKKGNLSRKIWVPQKQEDTAAIIGHWQKKNLSQLECTSPLQREFSFWPEKQAGMLVLMASEADCQHFGLMRQLQACSDAVIEDSHLG